MSFCLVRGEIIHTMENYSFPTARKSNLSDLIINQLHSRVEQLLWNGFSFAKIQQSHLLTKALAEIQLRSGKEEKQPIKYIRNI